MAKKNTDNYGDLLIDGMQEAVAIAEGRLEPAKRRRVTLRHACIDEPPSYSPSDVLAIRSELNVSQAVFGALLNVSTSTVQGWEQGSRVPDGPSRRLLELARKHPEVIAGASGRGLPSCRSRT